MDDYFRFRRIMDFFGGASCWWVGQCCAWLAIDIEKTVVSYTLYHYTHTLNVQINDPCPR